MSKVDVQTMAILFLKIHGYSNKDISNVLGLSDSLIRKKIYSVRKKLKK
ncbi:MAG: sigma-70 family RNA polymerase sigma factor [Erysipelotrichaceae bacterium]|nr:sigma-70 family RNA polymerase sigma factor [Erysipelotrichaceae bacterium]